MRKLRVGADDGADDGAEVVRWWKRDRLDGDGKAAS
jgi:hypothetical protein